MSTGGRTCQCGHGKKHNRNENRDTGSPAKYMKHDGQFCHKEANARATMNRRASRAAENEQIADRAKLATDQAKLATDQAKLAVDQAKLAADQAKLAADGAKAVAVEAARLKAEEAAKLAADEAKAAAVEAARLKAEEAVDRAAREKVEEAPPASLKVHFSFLEFDFCSDFKFFRIRVYVC